MMRGSDALSVGGGGAVVEVGHVPAILLVIVVVGIGAENKGIFLNL